MVTGDSVIVIFVIGATALVVSEVEASEFGSSVVALVTFPISTCEVTSGCKVGDFIDGVVLFLTVLVVGEAATGVVRNLTVVALEVVVVVAGAVVVGPAVTGLVGVFVVVALEAGVVVVRVLLIVALVVGGLGIFRPLPLVV